MTGKSSLETYTLQYAKQIASGSLLWTHGAQTSALLEGTYVYLYTYVYIYICIPLYG